MPTVAEAPPMARRPGGVDDALKRAFDAVVAALALLVLSPLLLVLALLVRLSSPGPAFYRQKRVGRDGKLFDVLKFRSMRVGNSGPSVTAGGDPRITPIGARLRQWKLDELPQLINVLRGEMSLVGPRPEVERYVQHYTAEQRGVLAVRPGITGVSQIEFRDEEALLNGRDDVEEFYLSTVMPTKLALDLRYVREHSFLGDLQLLLRTVLVIVRRDDAATNKPPASA
jgi:lipopolysaccharide/colanic/teichoic acid biosynthesis glycosyltransferase